MAKTYIDKKGYRRFSDTGKLVSRWVGEKKLGRPLRKEEPVHHINRDKLDNRRSNLWVFVGKFGFKRHDKAHKKDKKKFGFW